jgi:hypothetical protein
MVCLIFYVCILDNTSGCLPLKSVDFGQTTRHCVLEYSSIHLLLLDSLDKAMTLGEDQWTEFA